MTVDISSHSATTFVNSKYVLYNEQELLMVHSDRLSYISFLNMELS